jgi:hypothetical protein
MPARLFSPSELNYTKDIFVIVGMKFRKRECALYTLDTALNLSEECERLWLVRRVSGRVSPELAPELARRRWSWCAV